MLLDFSGSLNVTGFGVIFHLLINYALLDRIDPAKN